MSNPSYTVFAKKFSPRSAYLAATISTFIILVVSSGSILAYSEQLDVMRSITCAAIIIPSVCFGFAQLWVSAEKDMPKFTAQQLTEQASAQLKRCEETISKANFHIGIASEYSGKAKKEFECKAYSVFWDLVEQATMELGRAYEMIGTIPKSLEHYRPGGS